MSSADKVEVMDFLINVLKDHEKSLDTLITRAEDVIEDNQSPQMIAQNPPPLKINLRDWEEFKTRAIEAELVCFDMEDSTFLCNAITNKMVYKYTEKAPEVEVQVGDDQNLVVSGLNPNLDEGLGCLNGALDIGLELKESKVKRCEDKNLIIHDLDSLYTRNWLSRQIGIHRDFIVHGNVD